MKKQLLFTPLALLICINLFAQHPCKEVVGYYPNWQWYKRSQLVNPTRLDYTKYSIINYCFFKPNADGTIVSGDSWADENLLEGPPIWSPVQGHDFSNSVVGKAHAAGVKVLLSIGGWTWSDNFPQLAASATTRTAFAHSCRQLVTQYKLDGIDIDWEYPGYADHSGTPADKQNFTLLLKAVRDSLTAYGQSVSKTFLLSACFSADPAKAASIEWNNVVPLLDMINLMTYDFFGAWESVSNHNSPLYAPAQGDPHFNLNSAFTMLTQTYNVPAAKINLGAGFYGRSMTNCTALFGTHSGSANTTLFSEDDGSPMYYNVLKNLSQFTRYWDNTAKVPYLLGGPNQTFVSYDDKESIAEKAKYINTKGARGAIIWEITGDYIETTPGSGIIKNTPLVDTLNYVFCQNITVGIEQNELATSFALYPNPGVGQTNIAFSCAEDEKFTLEVYNSLGELVKTQQLTGIAGLNTYTLNLSGNGLYFVCLKGKNGTSSQTLTLVR